MIYLTGGIRHDWRGLPGLGLMLTPNKGNVPWAGMPWAADSGLYTAAGQRAFDVSAYLRWLQARRAHRADCLFATAPDVVGDAAATWTRSAPVLPQIRALGFPAALVAQDGWASAPGDWTAFDALFVGGTTAFKLSEPAYALAQEAKRRGKWVHMGRVNSGRRFRAARGAGYDSVDGTYLAFAPDTNMARLQAWQRATAAQPVLWEGA